MKRTCAQVHKQNRYTIHTGPAQRYHTAHSLTVHTQTQHTQTCKTHTHAQTQCARVHTSLLLALNPQAAAPLSLPSLFLSLTLQCLSDARTRPHTPVLGPSQTLIAPFWPSLLRYRLEFIPLNFNQDERVRTRHAFLVDSRAQHLLKATQQISRMGIQAWPLYPRTCALPAHTQGPDLPAVNPKPQLIGHPVYLPACLMADLQLP